MTHQSQNVSSDSPELPESAAVATSTEHELGSAAVNTGTSTNRQRTRITTNRLIGFSFLDLASLGTKDAPTIASEDPTLRRTRQGARRESQIDTKAAVARPHESGSPT